jgi:Protein of unknown function (DUF3192)
MRTLIAVVAVSMLFACSGAKSRKETSAVRALTLAELAASNRAGLLKLSVGLSKQEVISLMGSKSATTHDGPVSNPWTVETFLAENGARYEGLYYIVRENQPFTPVRKSLATAIVFKNGRVIGWGEHAFERYR